MKRIKSVPVSVEFIRGMLTSTVPFVLTENPLPKDARVVNVSFDAKNQRLWMVVESDAFPEIAEGEFPHEHPMIAFRQYDDDMLAKAAQEANGRDGT